MNGPDRADNLSDETIIIQTKKWVDSFIVHYNICPFAEKVVTNKTIDFHVVAQSDMEECLVQFFDHFIHLLNNDSTETALIIFPRLVGSFDDYLEFLAIANQLIEEQGLAADYQLASFHPEYCFEGEEVNDAANFTNRSPWPMLHIIRQSSIEQGLKFYKNPEQIPERNIKLTRELGYDFLNKLRERCLRTES